MPYAGTTNSAVSPREGAYHGRSAPRPSRGDHMIGTSGGLLEIHALLILKSFATHVLPARAVGLSRSFCDIVGMIQGGRMIGVKLKRSVSAPLTPGEVGKCFGSEISLMKSCCCKKTVRLELWVALSGRRWQFFEITGEGVREVEHPGQP